MTNKIIYTFGVEIIGHPKKKLDRNMSADLLKNLAIKELIDVEVQSNLAEMKAREQTLFLSFKAR